MYKSGGRLFDIIVFGATGFTGNVVVNHLLKLGKHERLSWAVTGKSDHKLEYLKNSMKCHKVNVDAFKVDVFDLKSLENVTEKTKLVINCIGPYSKYGESVVKSCLQTRTHVIDLSGEPLYLEKMQLNYNEDAIKNKTYVIGSCGFDSIPADLGFTLLRKKFDDICSVETFITMYYNKRLIFNLGTWESLISGYSNYNHLKIIRKQLFGDLKFPSLKRETFRTIDGKYVVPFPGSDRSVIKRTQLLNYKHFSQQPIPIESYFVTQSISTLTMLVSMIMFINALCRFEVGRSLLMKHPYLFSFGMTGGDTPSDEQLATSSFEMIISGKQSNGKQRKLRITGPEVGYTSASICAIQAALTILREQHKIPVPGGVLTPAFAFQSTNLINKLSDNGIKFEFVNDS